MVISEQVHLPPRRATYHRDGPEFLDDFVSESKCCRTPGEGFGAIGLNTLALLLFVVPIAYRTPFVDNGALYGDDNWWTYEPSWIAPELVGVELELSNTGGWHWTFPKVGALRTVRTGRSPSALDRLA